MITTVPRPIIEKYYLLREICEYADDYGYDKMDWVMSDFVHALYNGNVTKAIEILDDFENKLVDYALGFKGDSVKEVERLVDNGVEVTEEMVKNFHNAIQDLAPLIEKYRKIKSKKSRQLLYVIAYCPIYGIYTKNTNNEQRYTASMNYAHEEVDKVLRQEERGHIE